MKRILLAAATVTAMALGLVAANSDSFQLTVMGPKAGVIGGVVKDAPYSGEEVTTQDNTLADGTKIHNETHTKVYRDAEGRTRRESENMINIYDPVAAVSYVLNPKTKTGQQMTVRIVTTDGSNGMTTKTVTSGGNIPINGATTGSGNSMEVGAGDKAFFFQTNTLETVGSGDDPDAAIRAEKLAMEKLTAAQTLDQVKADTQARMEIIKMADGTADGGLYSFKAVTRAVAKKESLGTQTVEGLLAEGIRTTSTLETGAVGNDRPINIVSERWMSNDLQTVVMTKHSDPRSGEEVFRLTNVNRSTPDPSLFQWPSEYKMAQRTNR
jgi:Spy/CpxP family protein refolding chaperone